MRYLPFVSIGGGIGSFCWVNALRVHGISADAVGIIGKDHVPYRQFKTYCDAVGLTENEHLRSDSGSRPDNFWGFPGYGLEEALTLLRKGKLGEAGEIFWQLFAESLVSDFYTPTAGRVYKAIEREAQRIKWEKMFIKGDVVAISKKPNGLFSVEFKNRREKHTVECSILHLSLGHTSKSIKTKPNYFYSYNGDFIDKISKGKVAVLGRGTTAALVVEKFINKSNQGFAIEVVSVFQDANFDNSDYRDAHQATFRGWRLQQFNWPRSAFGGELAEHYKASSLLDRMRLAKVWGSPTAVYNHSWLRKIQRAANQGIYSVCFSADPPKSADYIIDCTGFSDKVSVPLLYKKLARSYNLSFNNMGGFVLDDYFRISELSGNGQFLFVSGIGASGNHYGPVDSFAGHQYAALKTVDALQNSNYSRFPRLTALDSATGWLKWLFAITI